MIHPGTLARIETGYYSVPVQVGRVNVHVSVARKGLTRGKKGLSPSPAPIPPRPREKNRFLKDAGLGITRYLGKLSHLRSATPKVGHPHKHCNLQHRRRQQRKNIATTHSS